MPQRWTCKTSDQLRGLLDNYIKTLGNYPEPSMDPTNSTKRMLNTAIGQITEELLSRGEPLEEEEPELCPSCSGSGEGLVAGKCRWCKGSGVKSRKEEDC